MELIKVNEKSKVENGNVYMAVEYRLGKYMVDWFKTIYENGVSYERISVSGDWDERYLPEIYYNDNRYGKDEKWFDIQTTSYGALGIEDIQKVIAGYNEAIEAVKILTVMFC